MSDSEQNQQIRESVQHIADRAAREAVKEVLTVLGFDLSDPIKAQEQMAVMRKLATSPTLAADLAFLSELHSASDKVREVSLSTIVRVVVTAALGLLVLGTKEWWLSHITGVFK